MTHPERAVPEHNVGGDRAAAGAWAVISRSGAAPRAPRRREWRQQSVKDHLGSVRLVVDADTGEVVQQLDYGPFGEVLVDTHPGFQPFGFAGGVAPVQ